VAIVRMDKFMAIGIDAAREPLMTQLMELGVTELNSQKDRLNDDEWSAIVTGERRESAVSKLEARINAVSGVLKTLDAFDTSKKPLFRSRRTIDEHTFSEQIEGLSAMEADADKVLSLMTSIKELQNETNKIETAIIGFAPWADYDIPLETYGTESSCVNIGMMPSETDIGIVQSAIEEKTDMFELAVVSEDADSKYVYAVYHKEAAEAVGEALREYSFGEVVFKDIEGTTADNIARCEAERAALADGMRQAEESLAAMAEHKESIELYHDYLVIERDRAQAADRMLITERTFYLDGWVPASASEALGALLARHGCYYEITAPEKDEETPILLKNNEFIEPVEIVTSLYALPSSKEIDPTPVFALFYICFFGIMFADMGYGAILAAVSFVLVRSGKMEGTARKFIKQLGYCGVATFIWGMVFGSFFGDLVSVASATFGDGTAVLDPLWFDPVENTMYMMVFSCIVGLIHIFVALGVKAHLLVRDGKVAEAIGGVFLWYALIPGLVFLLAGDSLFAGASTVGLWMTILSAGGIIVVPMFAGKGAKRLSGFMNLYGIVGYLSDVLSYMRLLALCLAGSVIAEVFNMLAGMSASGILGIIPFILIVFASHIFNFLMSGMGAFVHSIRLQYVEFMGKFYEGSGIAFEPFMRKTEYIRIVKEDV